LIKVRKLP